MASSDNDWFFDWFDKGLDMPRHWAIAVGTLMVLATLVCLTLGFLIMFGVI